MRNENFSDLLYENLLLIHPIAQWPGWPGPVEYFEAGRTKLVVGCE